jgi:hypothetical protein
MNEIPSFRLFENAPLGPAPAHPKFCLDEPLHPVQIEGLRKMTAAQKFRQIEEMYRWGVFAKKNQLAREFPLWDEDTLEREARRAYMYGPD